MEAQTKIPFYAKATLIFLGLFVFVYALYVGQNIIIPILYATIIATLLNPLVNFLVRKRINKVLAISIAVLVAIMAVIFIFYIISSQVTMFSETYPQLKAKFTETNKDLVQWASEKFNIRQSKITNWMNVSQGDAIDNFAIGEKLSQAGRLLVVGMLLPVYVFMILFYKTHLLDFIRKLFRMEHQASVGEVLNSTKKIIQSYLVGLFFEMLIMAVLNSVGLLLLGIQYAIILGITGAILNIVPYVGGIIAIALPMIIAFVTKDSSTYPLLVLAVYLVIQFIDNHYIIPQVVAKRVKINALISIIVVLIGAALWGIPGMFLSIPLTAIIKVIFDHIDSLKPWGFLLGNIVPTETKYSFQKTKTKLFTQLKK
jgi:predicted PurR-regulated permease PerM